MWIGGGRPEHLVVALAASVSLAATTRWTRWAGRVALGAAIAVWAPSHSVERSCSPNSGAL